MARNRRWEKAYIQSNSAGDRTDLTPGQHRTEGEVCCLRLRGMLQRGESALYVAVDNGHVGVVALLLDFMQTVDCKVTFEVFMTQRQRHD